MKYSFFVLLLCFSFARSGAEWEPGEDIIDLRDGQKYKTVVIGSQVWMAENLNIGAIIPSSAAGKLMQDNGIIEKYCWENLLGNCDGEDGKMKRGGFYEWEEAVQYWNGQPQLPVRGICPAGWHIPSNAEWNQLLNYLGGTQAFKNLVVGGGSGFDALMTGYRCTLNGSFRVSAMSADTRTYFWTAEQTDAENAPFLEIGQNSLQAINFRKSVGLCVRCLWDGAQTSINSLGAVNELLEFAVNPNPFSNSPIVEIMLNSSKPEQLELSVIDIIGSIVLSMPGLTIYPGINRIEINTESLPQGNYFVICRIGDYAKQKSIIIIK